MPPCHQASIDASRSPSEALQRARPRMASPIQDSCSATHFVTPPPHGPSGSLPLVFCATSHNETTDQRPDNLEHPKTVLAAPARRPERPTHGRFSHHGGGPTLLHLSDPNPNDLVGTEGVVNTPNKLKTPISFSCFRPYNILIRLAWRQACTGWSNTYMLRDIDHVFSKLQDPCHGPPPTRDNSLQPPRDA